MPLVLRLILFAFAAALTRRHRLLVDLLLEIISVQDAQVRAANGGRRKRPTAEQRARLAVKAVAVPRDLLAGVALITYSPDTFLRWYRQLIGQKYNGAEGRKAAGRPVVSVEVVTLICRMARENPCWGYRRLVGELAKVGAVVSKSTVGRVLADYGLEPAPRRKHGKSWADFIGEHLATLYAADFFTVEVQGLFATLRCQVLVVMALGTRRVEIAGITPEPDQDWMVQIARNLTDAEDGFLKDARYLIHDRGSVFGERFAATLAATDVKTLKLPARSPNLNAFCERFNRTIKEECLHHFVICSQRHLEVLVREFCAHYHHERPHQGLGNRTIEPMPMRTSGPVKLKTRLGGLLKHYYRDVA